MCKKDRHSRATVYYYGCTFIDGKFVSVYSAKPKRNDGFCIAVKCCNAQRSCMF